MISFVPFIGAALNDDAAVRAIAGTRIWGMRPEQGQPVPDVLIVEISGTPSHTLTATTPPWRRRVSVESRAKTERDADQLKLAVMGALANVDGTTRGNVRIQSCRPQGEFPGYDAENGIHRRIVDFEVVGGPA